MSFKMLVFMMIITHYDNNPSSSQLKIPSSHPMVTIRVEISNLEDNPELMFQIQPSSRLMPMFDYPPVKTEEIFQADWDDTLKSNL